MSVLLDIDHLNVVKVQSWIWCFWPSNYLFRWIQVSVWQSGACHVPYVLLRSLIGKSFGSIWEHRLWLDYWSFLEECNEYLTSQISQQRKVWLICNFGSLCRTIIRYAWIITASILQWLLLLKFLCVWATNFLLFWSSVLTWKYYKKTTFSVSYYIFRL